MVQQFSDGGTVLILRTAGRILEVLPVAFFHVASAIDWQRRSFHKIARREMMDFSKTESSRHS
jgi:hypothetical protein